MTLRYIYISAFLLSVLLSRSHYQFEILRRYVFLLTVFYRPSLTVPLAHVFVSLVQVLSLRALVFYNPRVSMVQDLLSSIDDILEGARVEPLHILTAALAIDLGRNGVIKWRMSRESVRSMKRERWAFAVFRTDNYCPGGLSLQDNRVRWLIFCISCRPLFRFAVDGDRKLPVMHSFWKVSEPSAAISGLVRRSSNEHR